MRRAVAAPHMPGVRVRNAVERLVLQLVSKAAVGAVVWVTHDAAQAERVASTTLQLRRNDEEAAAPALEAEALDASDNK
jgi:ABC-type iron transport system FetAB ATPase subunit